MHNIALPNDADTQIQQGPVVQVLLVVCFHEQTKKILDGVDSLS